MKKIIKNEDGSEIVYEGTLEEIQELEKNQDQQPRKTEGKIKGKRILNE